MLLFCTGNVCCQPLSDMLTPQRSRFPLLTHNARDRSPLPQTTFQSFIRTSLNQLQGLRITILLQLGSKCFTFPNTMQQMELQMEQWCLGENIYLLVYQILQPRVEENGRDLESRQELERM